MYIVNKTRVIALVGLALSVSGISAMKKGSSAGTLCKTVSSATHVKPAMTKRCIAEGSPEAIVGQRSALRAGQRYALDKAAKCGLQKMSERAADRLGALCDYESKGMLPEQSWYGLDLWKRMNPDRVQYLEEYLKAENK